MRTVLVSRKMELLDAMQNSKRDTNFITNCIEWLKDHFPPLVKHDQNLALLLVLGGLYFLVMILALLQLVRTHYRFNKSITKQKLFFIFTAFCALV